MSTIRRLVSALAVCGLFLLGAGRLAAGTYYVSLSGNDKNDGKTPARAWRTVSYAATKAAAGDTVFIKAGNYGREIVEIKHSGAPKAPVVFQGYQDDPGDTPDPKYRPGDNLDPNVLPVLEGDGTGMAILVRGKSFIVIRHLGATSYAQGICPFASQHIVLENVYVVDMHSEGVRVDGCEYCTIRNCVVTDGWMSNIRLVATHNSLVENCKTYGFKLAPPEAAPDYYIIISDGHDNVVRDCLAENLHPDKPLHPGHGIGIKDVHGRGGGYLRPHSCNNTIINCTARNHGEHLFVSHEAHHNEFLNCTACSQWRHLPYNWHEGIDVRDGAHDNLFRNIRVEGTRRGVALQDTVEGPRNPDGSPATQVCSQNTFVNCVFTDVQVGFEMWNANDNLFKNCTVENVDGALFRFAKGNNRGNRFRNSIVANVRGPYQGADENDRGDVRFTYTDFWRNRFDAPAGTGNLAMDPLFADAARTDFHLKSAQGRWDTARSNWVKDRETSPCLDAGDPSDDYALEPQPNGGRINIGAYGGTAQASQSPARGD